MPIKCDKYGPKQKRTEYVIWQHAKDRCNNPNSDAYAYYGGRGIKMCPKWEKSFQAFFDYVGFRPVGRSLDRIDNNKGYEPGNVRWATPLEQMRNRINIRPIEQCQGIYNLSLQGLSLSKISKQVGLSIGVVQAAIRRIRREMAETSGTSSRQAAT